MFSLTDKISIVTGAGSGIGQAIAIAFARQGATVVILDRDEAGGTAVAEAINAGPAPASAGNSSKNKSKFIRCDVSSESDCSAAARAVLSEFGRCDILVNNAGIGHVGTALTTSGEDLDRLWAVNVKGILQMTRAVLPAMIERKWGSVVNMASVGGVMAVKDRLAYCTTKFAVVGMTKCMAIDHADSKVRFNAICPGRVETPFVQARLKEYPDPKAAYASMAATQALNRMGRPEEIAAAAVYLASDESCFVTGSALLIDGGMSTGK
jgi:NAD(P)-dependent dehydrogenase (short-subunit alcohol dehydrogenase family)